MSPARRLPLPLLLDDKVHTHLKATCFLAKVKVFRQLLSLTYPRYWHFDEPKSVLHLLPY